MTIQKDKTTAADSANKKELATAQVSEHTLEMEEILSRPASWLLRNGMMCILGIVVLFFFATWFIKYPDSIRARFTLTSFSPPIPLLAKTEGRIQHILVKNFQRVNKGQVLAVLESPSSYEEVTMLKSILAQPMMSIDPAQLDPLDHLGLLQNSHAEMMRAFIEFKTFESTNYLDKKRAFIQKELSRYSELLENVSKQITLQERDVKLAHYKYSTDSVLFSSNVLTKLDLYKSESELNQRKHLLYQTSQLKTTSQIRVNELSSQLNDLEKEAADTKNRLTTNVMAAYDRTVNEIKQWEQTHVLISPIEGEVILNNVWSTNQTVKMGDLVLTIVPPEQTTYCVAQMPITGAGKVQSGQNVIVKFDNYPYKEFGFVKGYVRSISSIPIDGVYSLEIALPNGLTTSYGKTLEFKQEIKGEAEIITNDLRLIERIVNQFRSFTKY
ncbi:MAG TPA: HlyD family efflux transporter periplasmic adaptor subunit [Chryseosolibacter sp.]